MRHGILKAHYRDAAQSAKLSGVARMRRLPEHTGHTGRIGILANMILLNSLRVELSIVSTSIAEADSTPKLLAILRDAKIGVGEGWSADVVVKAVRQREIVGCCAVDFAYPASILHSLAVRKRERRRGVGRALVEHSVQIAAEQGATIIVALTMFWNVGFFRKCGFDTTSRKLLPRCLAGNPLVFDQVFRRTIPMKRDLVASPDLAIRG